MINDQNRIFELAESINNSDSAMELKKLLIPYKQGSIGIVQINPIAGDLEYNSKKIIKYIKLSQSLDLDLVVFPELSLTGHPIKDIPVKYPFFAEESIKWLNEIAKLTIQTTAIVGFIESKEDNSFCNSMAVLSDGKIQKIINKNNPDTVIINGLSYGNRKQK